jgi:hypothetical protein
VSLGGRQRRLILVEHGARHRRIGAELKQNQPGIQLA